MSERARPGPRFPIVVFDMDGVVVDSEAAHEQATLEYLRSIGLELDVKEVTRSMYGRRTLDLCRELAVVTGCPVDDVYRERERLFWRIIGDGLVPMAGLNSTLARLRRAGVRLGLATSATRAYAEHVLGTLGLVQAFETVVVGDDVTSGKPDPETYLLAASRLQADPVACAAIEDSPNGVMAAAQAGMHTVAVPNDATRGLSFPGASVVLQNLEEAANYLLGQKYDGCA